ncbi:hypothetical protein CJ030_MR2G004734 [Morella rubra]|uniref:F-box domain-containing protein n=1 Tax=Morella rubra TaxID=262757 RepID=A0A6A1WJ81_9ROSI|nr:hypothetical protein CJ030_MR2G004734 [Morella rubra]
MAGDRVEWSDLPTELCSIIGERLDRRIDVFRFRSVCRSWRSAIPLGRWPAYLGQRTFYTLQRLNPSASTSNPAYAAADHKSWLIEVDESNSGTSRRIDPSKSHPLSYVSNLPIRYSVNLLDTRLVELTTAYRLRHNFAIRNRPGDERINIVRCGNHGVQKVVMVPNPAKNNNADDQVCSFFVVFDDGNLGLANCGDYSAPDEDLTLIGGGRNVECHDIVVYKGKLYFVDMWGAVWWIKYPSLELVQFCRPLYGFGSPMKRLVESCGALYLLNGYFTMMNSSWLIEVEEESNSGQLRLLNPANFCLSECRRSKSNGGISYPVNLLYYQIVELTRAYTLGSRSATTSSENERIYVDSCRSIPGVHKAVMIPKSAKTNADCRARPSSHHRRNKSLAKALFAAARIAAASMNKTAAATKIDVESRVKEATFAKKKAREALERLASLLVSKEKGEDKNDLSRRPIRLSENENKKGFRLGMSFQLEDVSNYVYEFFVIKFVKFHFTGCPRNLWSLTTFYGKSWACSLAGQRKHKIFSIIFKFLSGATISNKGQRCSKGRRAGGSPGFTIAQEEELRSE